ncbi:MAG TPA: nitrilase-related carbon-nitrogen hydrolase, partial [Acidimicrobiales bacterium]|nr:nitrilase-related carbon-nitrogen hydrolase [Acidimicrobiales bacterium]
MATIRVGLAQLNVTVGDLDGNAARVLQALRDGADQGCHVVAVPELALVGYPPEDLLLKEGFVEDATAALGKLAAASPDCLGLVGTALVADAGLVAVGAPTDARDVAGNGPAGRAPRLANAAAFVGAGRLHGAVAKRRLPNYAVFDEQRWFLPGAGPAVPVGAGGTPIGVMVCEDAWVDDGPGLALARAGARLLVVLNASPYSRGRREERREVLSRRAVETGCPLAYVNLVGGQDELVFDGASLVVGADGAVLAAAPQFDEALLVVDVEVPDDGHASADLVPRRTGPVPSLGAPPIAPALDPTDEVYEALVVGTRDYVMKNGFSSVVVALSGGIDSSLVAAVAVDALGPAA